ncbi:MAG: hypothetical protein ABI895_01465 [Deltaproteobacteria bacterium]
MAESAAQIYVDVVCVVPAEVVFRTINVRATSVVARDLVAAPAGAAGLAEASAFGVAANGRAPATDDTITLTAVLIPRAQLTEPLLSGYDAFALPIANTCTLLAGSARGSIRRAAVR